MNSHIRVSRFRGGKGIGDIFDRISNYKQYVVIIIVKD